MRRTRGGYTLFEVLIVLAISALLFISAFTVFLGQQRSTEFSQAMEDVSSKIQTYVAQINSGTFLDIEGYSCTLNGLGKPVLSVASGGIGTNEDCIVLGRAFHVFPGGDNAGKIYVYTVLGSRNQTGGGTASTISQANPQPALIGPSNDQSNWVLVDEYDLQRGARVLSSTINSGGTQYDIVGIYNSLQSDAPETGGAAASLIMKAYPGPVANEKSDSARACIEENLAICNAIQTASAWNICIERAGGGRTAELSISSKPAGISTQINDKACGP